MTHRQQPESKGPQPISPYAALPNPAVVFPGKPYMMDIHPGNVAVKRSLQQIFDEFSEVISGELKSLNMEEFEAEQKRNRNQSE